MQEKPRFVPRSISGGQAEEGYNNEGRGELIGYLAEPMKHEETCRYRISTGGDANKTPHEACSCRLGLWRDTTVSQRVVNDVRKTAKRTKKTPKPKAKRPAKVARRKSAPKLVKRATRRS